MRGQLLVRVGFDLDTLGLGEVEGGGVRRCVIRRRQDPVRAWRQIVEPVTSVRIRADLAQFADRLSGCEVPCLERYRRGEHRRVPGFHRAVQRSSALRKRNGDPG